MREAGSLHQNSGAFRGWCTAQSGIWEFQGASVADAEWSLSLVGLVAADIPGQPTHKHTFKDHSDSLIWHRERCS